MHGAAPQFVEGSRFVKEAYRFTCDAYEAWTPAGEDEVEHPVRVAELLAGEGFGADVLAAALLHDLVEDTDVGLDEIERRFGGGVGALVGAMTEDERIASYEERKAEHRARVAGAGRDVSAIYAADKLAKLRQARERGREPSAKKIAHYSATLAELRRAYPDLPFLHELERELRPAGERFAA